MRVDWTAILGLELLEATEHLDERGAFAKLWDGSTSGALEVDQVCVSSNRAAGTIRGLHLQVEPFPESKAIWCSSGRLWDVVVDTRPDQPTYGAWAAVELDARRAQVLRIPPGVAHGFQTLSDDTTVMYLISGHFDAGSGRTVPWHDPTLSIAWPQMVTAISEKDRTAPPWPW